MLYDVAIIGTGPAALSAALTLKLHEKEILWFGSPAYSDKVEKSEKIANYPGMGLIKGSDLNERFREHAKTLGLESIDKMVTNILPVQDQFSLLAENELYEAKTVLLATGVASAKGFVNEAEYVGRGVSYCATCDGFLYKGKTIAVYCGAERYEHEVEYLAELAEKVYLACGYKDVGISHPKVERISAIKEVKGGMKVSGIQLFDGTEIPVDGLFCLRNAVAPATLLLGLAVDGAHIVVNRQQETNFPGLYAAGDCTGRPYQIAKAVGEGNVAAHSILEYLSAKKKEQE